MNNSSAKNYLLDTKLFLFEEWQLMTRDPDNLVWEGFIYYKKSEDAINHLDIYDDYIDAYLTTDNSVCYRNLSLKSK